MCDTVELAQHVTLWINRNEMQGQFKFVLPSPTLVWSTPLGFPMWRMHAPTFNKWYKKNMNKNKKVTLHMLTYGAMGGCGLTSWVVYINDKFCDIRERNVMIRSEI
jgi:hypothetical protein